MVLNDGDDAAAVLEELRHLADDDLSGVRVRVEELPAATLREVVVALVAVDASRRAADRLQDSEPPPADPLLLAVALDDAAAVSDALGSIDDLDGLLRGVFDALSNTEARLLVFERAFRAMIERRDPRRDAA